MKCAIEMGSGGHDMLTKFNEEYRRSSNITVLPHKFGRM
jgi:hypothetical protein